MALVYTVLVYTEWIHCYIHIATFHIVWLLRNLSLGGKLCLRDDTNTAFVYSVSSPSLVIAGEPGKRHAMRAHRKEAVSDGLNPHSLGIMSAFGCIENLA